MHKAGTVFLVVSALGLFVLGFTNLPDYMLFKLENSYMPKKLPSDPAGIIVLGGGLDRRVTTLRGGGYALNSSADRLIAGFELSNRFPDVPLVYSGGPGTFGIQSEPGADVAQRVSKALYGGKMRFLAERKSRNTWENAVNTYRLLKPEGKRTWIVVTSAFHALRAEGCFKTAGFRVIVWPTDYRSYYNGSFTLTYRSYDQLFKSGIVIREFVGIVAYTLMGRMKWPFGKKGSTA